MSCLSHMHRLGQQRLIQQNIATAEDIQTTAKRLNNLANRTPVLYERAGRRILIKVETFQRTGTFKFRGAYNNISFRN